MYIWTVEDGNLVCYLRDGECKKCTQCCCTHSIEYQLEVRLDHNELCTDLKNEDWSHREGWHVLYAQGIWWYFKINSIAPKDKPCTVLENDLCSIWMSEEKFKPICRYWPFHPDNLEFFPGCGFSFEKVNL